jgi:uncharacterized membrane protein YfcA
VTAAVIVPNQVILAVAAFIGGGLNAVAGGGSFVTFPSLIFAGVAPVLANATSSVAMWPGAVASAIAYRRELEGSRRSLAWLSAASLVGGAAGALLLLRTSNVTFSLILPYLLLVASLVFTFGPRLNALLRARELRMSPAGGVWFQLAVSIYGGYFGGGMGIVMLAAFSLMGMTQIHAMNALKTLLAALINFAAIVLFIAAGAVAWGPGIVMIVTGTMGGYIGARVARKLSPAWMRRFVLGVAWGMTAVFFIKTYR